MIGAARLPPMKSRRVLIALSVLLLAVSLGAVPIVWDRLHTLYPTTETESLFLKNYTLKNVIEKFEDKRGVTTDSYKSGEAGRKFVTHTARFDGCFALRTEKWMPLMNALNDDVATQLVEYGATIFSQSGDPRQGFQFDYQLDKTVGSLTILPLASTSDVHRRMPLPTGTLDVRISIELTEKWFPKEPSMIRASIKNSTQ
jgi:hypothetical protein